MCWSWSFSSGASLKPLHASSPHADINIYCPGNAGSIMLTGNIKRTSEAHYTVWQQSVVWIKRGGVVSKLLLVSSWVIPVMQHVELLPTLYSHLNNAFVDFQPAFYVFSILVVLLEINKECVLFSMLPAPRSPDFCQKMQNVEFGKCAMERIMRILIYTKARKWSGW